MNCTEQKKLQQAIKPIKAQNQIRQLTPWLFKPKKAKFTLDREQKKGKKYNSKHWSTEENSRYIQFLIDFISLMKSSSDVKRKYHLYRAMSYVVRSRSPNQCRSHHQKMLKNFQSLQGIICQPKKQILEEADKQQEINRGDQIELVESFVNQESDFFDKFANEYSAINMKSQFGKYML